MSRNAAEKGSKAFASSKGGAPPAANNPLEALTSLRGIAAWWVVIYHFRESIGSAPSWFHSLASHGYLAVDLFFILSGFVLSLNYGKYFANGPRGALRFYGLRLARIYPLHFVMMILFLSVPIAVGLFSRQGLAAEDLAPGYFLMSLVLIQNWGFSNELFWNVPAWSISTEFFAYLLFPFLAWGAVRHLGSVLASVRACAALLIGLGLIAPAFGETLGSDIPRFGLIRCVIEFGAGIALHRLMATRPVRLSYESSFAICIACLCFTAFAAGFAPDYAVMPLGFLLLIYALADRRTAVARLACRRILISLGTISYSTYLCHYFIKIWIKFLLVRPEVPDFIPFIGYICLTCVASLLLYRWVEVPGQIWGRRQIDRLGDLRTPRLGAGPAKADSG